MRVAFHPDYALALDPRHAFARGKARAFHALLLERGLLDPTDVLEPEEAPWETVRLVHREEYVEGLERGTLPPERWKRIGLPWTPALVRRSRLAVMGSILAVRAAVEDGVAANLAGGAHHAFPDRGEGFCALNDVAVAVRAAQDEGLAERVLVVDLDVHQGNGTAAALAGDERVFTLSLHGERNYPLRKERSSLDVGLPDGTGDAPYLDALAPALDLAVEALRPDLVLYVAGVDVAAGDRFGRLSLSLEGIRERDRHVLSVCRRRGLPVAILPAGGYAKTVEETAALHAIVHEEAIA